MTVNWSGTKTTGASRLQYKPQTNAGQGPLEQGSNIYLYEMNTVSLSSVRYHFLEDAYKYHKQHVDSMTHQLQDKRKLIDEVSTTINNRYIFSYAHALLYIFSSASQVYVSNELKSMWLTRMWLKTCSIQ